MASCSNDEQQTLSFSFDEDATAWDSKAETVETSQAVFEALLTRLPQLQGREQALSILDFGCGTGLLSQRLAQCRGVAKVVGIDSSKGMINLFNSKREINCGGEKMFGYVMAIECEDDDDNFEAICQEDQFDFAVVHLALHHIRDIHAVVRKLAAALVPGGQVYLSDFENDGEQDDEDGSHHFHAKHKHQHVQRHGITRAELFDVLESAGLQDVCVEQSFTASKTIAETGEQKLFPFLLGHGTK